MDNDGINDWVADRISSTIITIKRKPANALALLLVSICGFVYFQSNHNPPTAPFQPAPVAGRAANGPSIADAAVAAPAIVASEQAPVKDDSLVFHYPPWPGEPPLLPNNAVPGTVIPAPGRELDVVDSFASFARVPTTCNFSSLELHEPFAPLCPDKKTFLRAASEGGRSGVDEPYKPRDCDMRWFHTEEICEIISKFDAIWVIGDSMMRNTAVAMITYLRKDLYEGPRAQWFPEPKEEMDCHCKGPFETASCMWYVARSTQDVWDNIKAGEDYSLKCPQDNMAHIEYLPLTAYPLGDTINGVLERLPEEKSRKPHAFILGHGVWNSLNETASGLWTDEVEGGINATNPWLTEENAVYPRLFITPNAAGDNKPVQYQETQGNIALHRFENNMSPYLLARGIDHLGMYNATIQNTTPDGTHAGMRSNLLKAMFIYNWLKFVDTEKH